MPFGSAGANRTVTSLEPGTGQSAYSTHWLFSRSITALGPSIAPFFTPKRYIVQKRFSVSRHSAWRAVFAYLTHDHATRDETLGEHTSLHRAA